MSFPANPAPDAALVCVHGIHHALTGRVLQTTNNLQREEAGEAVGVQLFWIHFTAEWEKLHGGDVWCPCWMRRDGPLRVS